MICWSAAFQAKVKMARASRKHHLLKMIQNLDHNDFQGEMQAFFVVLSFNSMHCMQCIEGGKKERLGLKVQSRRKKKCRLKTEDVFRFVFYLYIVIRKKCAITAKSFHQWINYLWTFYGFTSVTVKKSNKTNNNTFRISHKNNPVLVRSPR